MFGGLVDKKFLSDIAVYDIGTFRFRLFLLFHIPFVLVIVLLCYDIPRCLLDFVRIVLYIVIFVV